MHPYPQQEAYRAHALEEDLTGKDEVELAGPWQRIIAALINLALLFACIFVSLVLVLVFVSFFSFNHPIWTDITDSRLIAASLGSVDTHSTKRFLRQKPRMPGKYSQRAV